MSKKELYEKLIFAIEGQEVNGVIQAIRDGAEVDKEIVDIAYGFLESLEIEYADDKAFYAGCTAKNSDQDYIYRIVSRYAKGQKLDTIINTMFNRKTNPLKSKGEIITPKNKRELIKLMNKKRQYLGDIDISNIKDFSELFTDVIRTDFGGIELWDTNHVVNMNRMFEKFNFSKIKSDSPLFDWISNMDTSNVSDMGYMFSQSIGFNTDIGSWNTSNVLNMSYMFLEAEDFNQPLDKWDTSRVESMHYMFYRALKFNQDIGLWNTSKVKDMNHMFSNAESFNQNINNWNVSNVKNMNGMFFIQKNLTSLLINGIQAKLQIWRQCLDQAKDLIKISAHGMYHMLKIFHICLKKQKILTSLLMGGI